MTNISDIKNISILDFDYPLPDERIPRHPLSVRDSCLLLHLPIYSTSPSDRVFSDLPSLLPADSLLVCNDTRVINARIKFRKETGATIEVFLLEPLDPTDYVLMFQSQGHCVWSALVGNLKRWKSGPLVKLLQIDGREVALSATLGEPRPGNAFEITLRWDAPDIPFASIVEAAGYIPIPPYLRRDSEPEDSDDYQTVYARAKGSVAAPTAGLHFTDETFADLRAKGIDILPLTLHVGAGTFQPVKSEHIGEHPMHTEVFTITRDTVARLAEAIANRTPVTAVGTTSVRTLESLVWLGNNILTKDPSDPSLLHVTQWEAYGDAQPDSLAALRAIVDYMDARHLSSLTASTAIMIAPGFNWRIVDRIVTNFHQPQSTLLLLVSSFLESRRNALPASWRLLYEHALEGDYRFLSYGDACLFER